MRLPLTRLEIIVLTIIITPLTISPLCLMLLVRLGGLGTVGIKEIELGVIIIVNVIFPYFVTGRLI